MALHTKHRPTTFKTVIGNKAVVRSIESTLRDGEDVHAWLFSGPSGVGKTTISRIVAKHLGATASGVFEWNIANLRGVDTIRELEEKSKFRVPGSPVSVYILDECHQMTTPAQNMLLKSLEDPPRHVYFLLCTTEPEGMISTIRTRCLEYKLDALSDSDIRLVVTSVARKENITLGEGVLDLIVSSALGSARLALVMLAKCATVGDSLDEAIPLVRGSIQDLELTGPIDLASKFIDLMYGKRQTPWGVLVELLKSRVLRKRVSVKDFKMALLGVLGRIILHSPSKWAVDSALLIERNLFGANTEGGLIALVYTMWSECPAKSLGKVRAGNGRGISVPGTQTGGRVRPRQPNTELM